MATKTAAKTAAKSTKAADKKPADKAEKKNSAFMKALTPSAELAAIVGKEPLPRTEVVKKLWDYIKANNLQDAANKRNINADAKLLKVFSQEQVSMFQMAGLIGKHLS